MTRSTFDVEQRDGKVAEQAAIYNQAVPTIMMFLQNRYEEKWNARAHAYCSRHIKLIGIKVVFQHILWQAQHASGADVRGDDGQPVAEIRVLWLVWANDQVLELLNAFRAQFLPDELFDVVPSVYTAKPEQMN